MDMIAELLAGRLRDPDSGAVLRVSTRSVVIARSLAGEEAALVKSLDLPSPFAVIADPDTTAALGDRIERALSTIGAVIAIRLPAHPRADAETAATVAAAGSRAGSFIAVGSGTINDLAKHAAAAQRKPCAVFATAASMNGYGSRTASITVDGHKKTVPAVAPLGIFMDLGVLAAAPRRLTQAGFGDAICRSTAQTDWYLAYRLRGRPYRVAPFTLFADLEAALLAEPRAFLSNEFDALGRLARVLVLSGFGMAICGGSEPASQGEHLISHYLDMMHDWSGMEPLHGEQIAVTTLVMARLQEEILGDTAPRLAPSPISEAALTARFGMALGAACWAEVQPKLLDRQSAEALNGKLDSLWPSLQDDIAGFNRSAKHIEAALREIGAPLSYRQLGVSRDAFITAVAHAREIRNRYTFLDLAADAGRLGPERLIG